MTRTASPEAFEGRLLAMLRDVVDEAPSTQREGAHRRRSTKRRSFALVAASLAVLVTSLFVGSAVGGGQVFRIDGLQALRILVGSSSSSAPTGWT